MKGQLLLEDRDDASSCCLIDCDLIYFNNVPYSKCVIPQVSIMLLQTASSLITGLKIESARASFRSKSGVTGIRTCSERELTVHI
jgi:hypothetical protein